MAKAEKFASWLISTIEKNEPETAAIIIQEELAEIESNEVAALKAENEKLRFMIDNGLGWEDLNMDDSLPKL